MKDEQKVIIGPLVSSATQQWTNICVITKSYSDNSSSLTLYVRLCSPTFYKVLQRFDTCEILDGLFVLRAYLTTHSDILNPECSSAKASRRYWVKIFALVVKFFG